MKQDKYEYIPNFEDMVSSESIIQRILENYDTFIERNRKKQEKAILEALLERT
jgi:hypothetical protein